jgi:hypothetical protein
MTLVPIAAEPHVALRDSFPADGLGVTTVIREPTATVLDLTAER